MAQAVPIVAAWITAAGAAVGIAVAPAIATFAATVFVYSGAAYLMNRAMQALAPRPPQSRGINWSANYSGTGEPRRIIYGKVRVGGMHVIPGITTGNDGKFLHFILALAGHECNSIGDVFFNEKLVGPTAAVTGTEDDGKVTSGNFNGKAWVRRYLGTSTQTVDYIISQSHSTAFGADFRGRGVAYLAIQLRYASGTYASGVPNVTADVEGKLIYDPRTTSTAYSNNPALCVRDFLVNEVGFDADQIDDDLVSAAANICDQTVNIPTATTEPRYVCNALLLASESWQDNLAILVDAMHGRVVYRDGQWRIYAGAWDVPTVTLQSGDFVGPMQVQTSLGREEKWNAVRVWYVDPLRESQRVEAYPRRFAAYETQDGGERIWLELELPGVSSEYQAQRIGEFSLRQSRNQLKVTGRLRPEYIKLSCYDTVYLTDDDLGWTLKSFRIISMDIAPTGEVDVALVEEGSATWTDLVEGDYNNEASTTAIDPSGGAGGPYILDPLFAADEFWSDFDSGGGWTTNNTSAHYEWGEGWGADSDNGGWRLTIEQSQNTSGAILWRRLTSVRTPSWILLPKQHVSKTVRWRVNSKPTFSGFADADRVLDFFTEFWPENKSVIESTGVSITKAEIDAVNLGEWQEAQHVAQIYSTPASRGAIYAREYIQAQVAESSKHMGVGQFEFDAYDATVLNNAGDVTFATAPEIRSGTESEKSVAPDTAAAELDRRYVATQHGAGKATAVCALGNVSGTVCLDCSSSNVFSFTMTGNINLVSSNELDGQFVNLKVVQDASGGRSISFDPTMRVIGTLGDGAYETSLLGFQYDANDATWLVAISAGW